MEEVLSGNEKKLSIVDAAEKKSQNQNMKYETMSMKSKKTVNSMAKYKKIAMNHLTQQPSQNEITQLPLDGQDSGIEEIELLQMRAKVLRDERIKKENEKHRMAAEEKETANKLKL